MPISLRGQLLIATPPLADPNFDRSVVFMLDHDEQGAVGVVLNRPTARTVASAAPRWVDAVSTPSLVFAGGPVETEVVIALARRSGIPTEGWTPLLEDIGTIDLAGDASSIAPGLDALRIFVGYSGWGPGQLEGEIEAGGWFVVRAHPTDPFAADSDGLWYRVLRRQRGRLAMFANCPADVAQN